MKDAKGRNCTEYYHYWEIVSCVRGSRIDPDFKEMYKNNRKVIFVNGHLPFYELNRDQTGTPYESVLDLRRDKIQNFLSVKHWHWVTDLIPVNYEKLLHEGMDFLIKDIEQRLGETRACNVFPPQVRMHNPLTLEYLHYIDDHVDWDTEALVGYTKGNYANLTVVTKQHEEKENEATYVDKDEELTKSKDEKSDHDNQNKSETADNKDDKNDNEDKNEILNQKVTLKEDSTKENDHSGKNETEKEIEMEAKKSDDNHQSNSNNIDHGNDKRDDTTKDTKSTEKEISQKEEPKRENEELDTIETEKKENTLLNEKNEDDKESGVIKDAEKDIIHSEKQSKGNEEDNHMNKNYDSAKMDMKKDDNTQHDDNKNEDKTSPEKTPHEQETERV